MKSRGFTDDDMYKYSMRLPGLTGGFAGRVVIPNQVISHNWTDMYVARTYMNHPNRYKNPPNSRKSKILFNYHNIPDNPDVLILNEGPLNSIIAGDNSVASFGKALSHDQLDLIIKKNPKKLYVSYDTDAIHYALNTCEAVKAGSDIKVYFVELPDGKDAVDLGRSKYLDIVYNSKEFINTNMYYILKSLEGS